MRTPLLAAAASLTLAALAACAYPPPTTPVAVPMTDMDHRREGGVQGRMGPMGTNDPTNASRGPTVGPTGAINPGGTTRSGGGGS